MTPAMMCLNWNILSILSFIFMSGLKNISRYTSRVHRAYDLNCTFLPLSKSDEVETQELLKL